MGFNSAFKELITQTHQVKKHYESNQQDATI